MSATAATNIELRIPRQPEFVRIARWMTCGLAARLQFPLGAVKDIELAVGEACTNAVEHAKGPQDEAILIRFIVESRRLVIEVIDYGQGFCEEDEGDGLGLVIMRSVMDHVEICCGPDTGACVRMVKQRDGS